LSVPFSGTSHSTHSGTEESIQNDIPYLIGTSCLYFIRRTENKQCPPLIPTLTGGDFPAGKLKSLSAICVSSPLFLTKCFELVLHNTFLLLSSPNTTFVSIFPGQLLSSRNNTCFCSYKALGLSMSGLCLIRTS